MPDAPPDPYHQPPHGGAHSDPGREDVFVTEKTPHLRLLIPLVVAIAFFMEQLDATIVTTAIPDMAHALHTSPIQMNLAVSAYVLTLAVFIPLSGWCADRFGERRIFIIALGLFTAGSALCGATADFPVLVATRVVQGLGGAMMTPVGRLILLRSFPRTQLVKAMTYVTLPAIAGPLIGPLLGGYLTTYLSWRWIFYVNLPFGLIGMALAYRFLGASPPSSSPPFDLMGFALFGTGVGLLEATMEGIGHMSSLTLTGIGFGAAGLILAFGRRSRARVHPVIDLRLLRERAFAIATTAGGLCRVAMNGPVYLLPLMLQVGLGLSPIQSGSLTLLAALGAPPIRLIAGPALRRFGFRNMLLGSAVACAGALASFALIRPHTAHGLIALTIIFFGLVRSTQFMTSNTLAYADVAPGRLSHATSLGGLLQQLTVSFGVSFGAALLAFLTHNQLAPRLAEFHAVFLVLALLPLLALPGFARLRPQDGAIVAGRAARIPDQSGRP
ncbi:MAG: DHA2 family efflux MFS transporter permease subunit [Gammaproteobacteria bacterium]|nr:DHA2 family efflux MFS transporter permease subunit [Gammaproteobacteria bacterium]